MSCDMDFYVGSLCCGECFCNMDMECFFGGKVIMKCPNCKCIKHNIEYEVKPLSNIAKERDVDDA